ncbi:glycosyltransferase involved in cell wall biosynthesis [Puniceicoccus vermicola]
MTTSLSLGWRALWEIRRGKTVMVVTNPPLVPFMVRMACWLKGGRFVLLVHDVYPEVFVSVGWMRRGGIFFRLLDIPNQILLRSCREIIVLGRDMKELIAGKLPERCRFRVHTIPNWAMDEVVAETPSSGSARERFGIPDNAFLLVYNGNHGRTHFLEVWVALAAALLDDDRFRFLFAGEGSGKAKFEEAVERAGITNLHTTSFVSREDLASLLHSADLLLVSFFPGMAGVSVPSRLYNLMAASRPVLAVADSHSEVSQVLAEEDCGWAFPPEGSPQEIAAKIAPLLRELVENRDRLKEKGENGRKAVLEKYTREKVIEQYREVLTTFERSDTQSNGVTGEANGHR